MDSNRTSDNCFWMMGVDDAASKDAHTSLDWTREEDKAFEIALTTHYNDADMWGKIALAVPGKTVQDLKLHYEALSVMALESGKMPLSIYSTKGDVLEEKKLESEQVQRGAHWTEEEHSQFRHGLPRFGKGEWKENSKYSVRTRSSSQECCKGESSTAATEVLLPGNLERAAVHDGTQMLSGCATVTSCNAFGKRGRPNPSYGTVGCRTNAAMQGVNAIGDGYRNQLAPPVGSLPISGHPTPSYGIVDIDLFVDGQYDIGATTDILDDVDLSLFPRFLN